MRTSALAAVAVIALAAGCGGKSAGTRAEDKDTHCSGDTPVAKDFEDPDQAYEAGCVDVRVHMGKKDPETGETVTYEDVVFCCPK